MWISCWVRKAGHFDESTDLSEPVSSLTITQYNSLEKDAVDKGEITHVN